MSNHDLLALLAPVSVARGSKAAGFKAPKPDAQAA
jgi:hypothetical protein